MYVGSALSEAHVWDLAHEHVEELSENDTCVLDAEDVDTQWQDEHGRGCAWYALHRRYKLPKVSSLLN